jgi:type IV pilus assembly protein PilC
MDADKKYAKGKINASSHREAVLALKENGVIAIYSLKKAYRIPWLENSMKAMRQTAQKVSQKTSGIFARNKDSEIANLLRKAISNKDIEPSRINIFIDRDPDISTPEPAKPKFKKKAVQKTQIEYTIPWEQISRPIKHTNKIKVSRHEITVFARQLSVLLDSGVTLPKSLSMMMQNRAHSPGFKKVLRVIHDEIQDGNTLSYVLSGFPRQFDSLCLGLVAVGEATGTLDQSFEDIAEHLETQAKIKKQVKTALSYPIVILVAVVAVMLFGAHYLVPMFREMFVDLGMELPMLTKVVFSLADSAQYVFGFIIALVIALKLLMRYSPLVKNQWLITRDYLFLRIPYVKDIVNSLLMYYFSYTLSLMLKNGIRMTDSLSMATKTVPNRVLSDEIKDCAGMVVEGVSLAESLSAQRYFAPLVCNMAGTGEEAGRLYDIMRRLSNYYSDDFKARVEAAIQYVQPASILLVALIAVPVILAIFIPVLDMSSGAFLRE